MILLSVPVQLRLAVAALFLCLPLISMEVALIWQANWSNLPLWDMGYWALVCGLFCIPLSVWLSSARKAAWYLAIILSGIWISASAWLSFRMHYPPLGFFTVFLATFLSGTLFWIENEMNRSFLNPQMTWYQGAPKAIPGLKCEVIEEEKKAVLSVSRIDEDGVFVFAPSFAPSTESDLLNVFAPASKTGRDKKKRELNLAFHFRSRRLTCPGIATLLVTPNHGRGLGAGVRFQKNSPDLKKEIGDFVEALRGEGYV